MINQLVTALGQELGLTSKEIADVVWLALQMQTPDSVLTDVEKAPNSAVAVLLGQNKSTDPKASDLFSEQDKAKDAQISQPPKAELHMPDSSLDGQGNFGAGLPLKVPDARSLREPLSLARSLKPFLQKVTAGLSTELDEAATVERIADEGIWMPVLKPALEPWLDLALVVDESLSMHLWQRTIAELQRLVSHYGVFRDVRVWSLVTDAQGQIALRPRLGAASRRKTTHRPKELIDPSGRRLILITTDCIDAIWQNGVVLPALKLWATSGSMAIVQMLPEWLWARTGLGFASAVRLKSLRPGVPNQQLNVRDLSPWDEVDLKTGIRMPVVTLEPEQFLALSKMVNAKGGDWSPGFVFEPEINSSRNKTELWGSSRKYIAEQRVENFRSTASPMARQLAIFLAASPVISLPITRIIQERLLPKSRQVHIAEVFLGGLLRPMSEFKPETNSDEVQYDFIDEDLRNILLQSITTDSCLNVFEEVSKYVASNLGLSASEFASILTNPKQAEDLTTSNLLQPFARVSSQILKKLGGIYAQFAIKLEASYISSENTRHTSQRRNKISDQDLSNLLRQAFEEDGKSLDLSKLSLTDLPDELVQLASLEHLNVSFNELTVLPDSIGQLANLKILDISSNQLSYLPEVVGFLSNLEHLNISFNQLTELPPEIGQLTALTSLSLSSNQLTELPPEIIQLTALTSLNLSSNQFSSISSFIKQLVSLKTLDFRGNPLPIPPEILGPKEMYKDPADVAKILEFYFSLKEEDGNTPLYEAKLFIVGEGGAGKTSLAKKIKDADYPLQNSEESTEGIDVIRWEFPYSNDITFRTNIWDFGGQEIYHTTHQFFLTERSLYILVADTRQDNTDFYYWLKVIELLGTNSPVIIVKNEKQERQCDVNERQLRGEFLNLKAVLATNLETNRGLDEIKTTIQQHISALPHVGQDLPKIWARVRAALENYAQNRNYITQAEYFDICRRNGFKDKQSMLFLSSYLHDLGVCLHFQTDKILKHTVILNPEWGTSAVYKVLDTDQVKTNLGCFTNADLEAIWHKGDYADMRDELLQLMLQFKVCYEIPGKQGNYIAPHLLDTEQPSYDWDITNNLVLRYKYDFMPKGMVTHFIVEMHRFIENNTLVWKTGVVLSHRAARAEIIEHYPTSEIRIRVAGAQRRNLLTIIRHEFQKIHDSYERLKYQDLIPCNCSECKDTEQPESYPYDTLQKALAKGKYETECRRSFENVNIRRLIDDVIDPTELMEQSDLDEGGYGRFERDHRPKSSRPKPEPIQKSPPTPMRNKIFISYSHQDTELFNELKIWLKPLERSGKLNVWDDTKIEPGQVWRKEIEQALASAKVAVLLVSPHFIASDFIDKDELPPLLNAAEEEGLTILWIPISHSPYKDTEFEKYQAAHSPQEPLDTLEKSMRYKAWSKIYQKIQTAFNPS